ncbi:hypothetical protein, partial [Streptomyces niveus]|uniref:hypothetical protein n=1 Tax=Streptomyces niveus TaxID=193462 RepID=UPI003657C1C0
LALTFGTLLSSQGTDASFVLTLSGFPPGFPSALRFKQYQAFSLSLTIPSAGMRKLLSERVCDLMSAADRRLEVG